MSMNPASSPGGETRWWGWTAAGGACWRPLLPGRENWRFLWLLSTNRHAAWRLECTGAAGRATGSAGGGETEEMWILLLKFSVRHKYNSHNPETLPAWSWNGWTCVLSEEGHPVDTQPPRSWRVRLLSVGNGTRGKVYFNETNRKAVILNPERKKKYEGEKIPP